MKILNNIQCSGCKRESPGVYTCSCNYLRNLAFEALVEVALAAKATLAHQEHGCGCDLSVNWICGPCALDRALEKLEAIE